jgi:hypothetical protein
MGAIFDAAKVANAGGLEALQRLSGDELAHVIRVASIESFQFVAIVPLLLVPVFAGIWIFDRRRQVATA